MTSKIDTAINQVGIIAQNVDKYGIVNIQQSFFIYTAIIIAVVMIALIVFLMSLFSKLIKQQITEQNNTNKEFLNKFESGMLGVNESVNGIYRLVMENKDLSKEDFIKIVTSIIKSTISEIQIELMLMVDRNNIIYNLEDIKKDIDVLIDTKVNNGRLAIKSFNFDELSLRNFITKSDNIVLNAKVICKKSFEDSSIKLLQIKNDETFNNCEEIYNNKKNVYIHLKRSLNATAKELGYEMEMAVSRVGGSV